MLRIHPLYAALALLALAACQRQAPAPEASAPAPQPAANAAAAHAFSPDINAADFAELDKTLSSDAFEGRGPGTPGEDKSVEYIKSQMQRMGLKPGNNGDWFQTVPMVETTADPATTLNLSVNGKPHVLNLGGSMAGAPLGALALVVAACAWAFGSVWSKRRNMPPAAMNTAAQMLTGGAVLLAFALLVGERVPASPPLSASLAIVYLAIAGSLVGFSAYLYLLNTVRPALATSYAYVNPPVAVLVGAVFGGEAVHAFDVVAMVVILAGVALIALARERNA